MKASSKRVLSLLASAVFILIAIVSFVNFVQPEYQAAQKLRGELAAKTNLYNSQKEAITQVQQLVAKSKASAVESLGWALPLKEDTASIVDQLQAISQASNVSIDGLSLDYLPIVQSKKEVSSFIKGIGTLKLILKIGGDYNSIKKFVESIETNVRVMDLKVLKLIVSEKNPSQISGDLSLETYYQVK
ncbi:MAG: type 4a pilus biogenesis protein PilO [Candidatus Pacebacteria bacterium]|nr:type 4a pilus biogenesis protein PilO [Candidatus Paceibacterota bacterium]